MLNKTPLLHQSFGPRVFFLSLSLRLFLWSAEPAVFTFQSRLLRPSREGALCLHPIERAPGDFVNSASPESGALLVFCINQGISASFSLLYFLIIDSGPPGSGPLKDLNTSGAQGLSPWTNREIPIFPTLASVMIGGRGVAHRPPYENFSQVHRDKRGTL